jgi:hypothetical protein
VFCTACGSQNPDAGAYCFNCGKSLTSLPHESERNLITPVAAAGFELVAPPSVPARHSQQPDQEVERIRRENPELIGVGGWLLWFCIITTIIAPLINIGSTLSSPSAFSVIDLGLAAFMLITGVNLWRITPRALRLTKILLAIQFWLGVVLFIAQIAGSATESSAGDSRSDTGAFRMLVGSTIWWFYFKKSKRVKATFGRTI